MQVEGIVIHKTPFKERDVICNLLLRSGETLSVYFYGGKGGGKKLKGSIVEVGFMLKVELQKQKKTLDTPIHIAKEYSLIWNSEKIRENFQAFYLSCFYMEFVSKITQDSTLDENNSQENAGLFKVLSNALFHLDKSLSENQFNQHQQLFLFLSKIIIELGISPDTENCLFCSKTFKSNELCLFDHSEGGFICMDCSSKKDEFLSENKNLLQEHQSSQNLREKLSLAYQLPYKDFKQLEDITHGLTVAELNYINYQFGFKVENFKTWKSISL